MDWSAAPPVITEDLFEKANQLGFGQLHIKLDAATGLQAVIALHSEKRGPALGGTRLCSYNNSWEALLDAMRLAHGMSYKAAIANLAHGGGKAVILQPKTMDSRETLFRQFGQFVDELNGRYITAMDSGTTVADMDNIAHSTHYVCCTHARGGDPSYYTALGTLHGIRAGIDFLWGDKPLNQCCIAIQGLGHVGYHLAKLCHEQGAKIIVCDTHQPAVQQCVDEFAAESVTPSAIYDVACDIFAPCALGAILNDDTIHRLQARIVAGSANNQLATSRHAQQLKAQHILYAPDYVINAGGLIFAAAQYAGNQQERVMQNIESIYTTLQTIFTRADNENRSTAEVADIIAGEKLQ